jgi:hypothetical protein
MLTLARTRYRYCHITTFVVSSSTFLGEPQDLMLPLLMKSAWLLRISR